jgi:hypothetical protein
MMKKGVFAIIAILVFAVGAIFGSIANGMADSAVPATSDISQSPSADSAQILEKNSPSDWVSESQIKVTRDRVVVELPDAVWATFTDTNSMDPVIDSGANALEIVPTSPGQIRAGDIVSYESNLVEGTIIHRVLETGEDSQGWFATMKGDNLSQPDPEKVRWEQIRRVVVAIIY